MSHVFNFPSSFSDRRVLQIFFGRNSQIFIVLKHLIFGKSLLVDRSAFFLNIESFNLLLEYKLLGMDVFFSQEKFESLQNTTNNNACLNQAHAAVAADSVVKTSESLGRPLPFDT